MNRAAIPGRTIGVNFNEQGRAEIRVWAPLAEKVELAITGKQNNTTA
jgi:1,4-alpha-glucan branching enzyme